MPHTAPHHAPADWHACTIDEAFARLDARLGGLSATEARHRRRRVGENRIEPTERVPAWRVLFEQFANALIVILLVATVVSAFLGHAVEAIAIAAIVLFSAALGFSQEFSAQRALEALRQLTAPQATVLRDDVEVQIPARELVPGDLILLKAGDRVPADARLIETHGLYTEEACLTGESQPVEKHTRPLPAVRLPLGEIGNSVFGGTAVTQGKGRALVTATGQRSEFGQIVTLLRRARPQPTPLQRTLNRTGHALALGALAVVALVVALGLARGTPLLEILIFGIALAVAVVPEALPAVVTVSLALGARRMSQRHALIRHLPAVETLGATSVICTDKTGTLTRDEMTVRRVHCAGQDWIVHGVGYEPRGLFERAQGTAPPDPALRRLLKTAALASDADLCFVEATHRWQVRGDPTEGALVVAAAKAGLFKGDLDGRFPRVGELPFTAETRRMTTLHDAEGGVFACVKGAPEAILPHCVRILGAMGETPLDESDRHRLEQTAQDMAGSALRVLAVARRDGATLKNASEHLTLLGLVGLSDPPRPESRQAIATCLAAGIRVILITGDHPITARAVALELGLTEADTRVVTGVELGEMDETGLDLVLTDTRVFARTSPADKLRIVQALQRQGHVTAMTGDGVNDAPALKAADIGVAMGLSGTDVSREAAAMVLADDNFASIVAAVEEGRVIFANIRKYLMYLISSNLGEIGLIAGASLLGLPMPLSAVQILYINLASDGPPALALAFDPPEKDLMQHAPRDPGSGLFTRSVTSLLLLGGAWSALVNLGLFTWMLHEGRTLEDAMGATFLTLLLIQFAKAYGFRSVRRSCFRHPFANRWLNRAVALELLVLPALAWFAPLAPLFSLGQLTVDDASLALILALSVLPALEAGKALMRTR